MAYNPYGDYESPPPYGGGMSEGSKGMPAPPPNPNVTSMPIGMGAAPNVYPNMGDISGMVRAPGLFSPGQQVLYRPAKSYGVAGDTVYPGTYESAMKDLNDRLGAYNTARAKMTGESITAKAGPPTNAIDMDKYQQIADEWVRAQREEEDKAAIAAQQMRNPNVPKYPSGPSSGPSSGPRNPAYSSDINIPKYRRNQETGEIQVHRDDAPAYLRGQYPDLEWIPISGFGGNSTMFPNYGTGAPTGAKAGAPTTVGTGYQNNAYPGDYSEQPIGMGGSRRGGVQTGIVPPYLKR